MGRITRSAERGAVLTEFAVVFPLLVFLLMGIIEYGFVFAQQLDLRNAVREGARLAAVNHPEGSDPLVLVRTDANRDTLLAATCAELAIARPVSVTFTASGAALGDTVIVAAETPARTLTGLIDWAFPVGYTLESEVTIRAEQDVTWADTDTASYPNGQPCP